MRYGAPNLWGEFENGDVETLEISEYEIHMPSWLICS